MRTEVVLGKENLCADSADRSLLVSEISGYVAADYTLLHQLVTNKNLL